LWAAGGHLSASVSGPPSITLELARQQDSGTLLLHLVNFDFRKPVQNLEASVAIPAGYTLREISLQTPDGEPRRVLNFAFRGNAAVFRIPRVAVYSLVLLRLEKSG
jgi:hypothetical protein